jgi:RND family efflux transporter MFP subunit
MRLEQSQLGIARVSAGTSGTRSLSTKEAVVMTLQRRLLPYTILALLLAAGGPLLRAAAADPPAPPVIVVEAAYPGANAAVVAESVAAPIEEQVNGIEKMLSMTSHCTNDGKYTLQLTFKPGTDRNFAQVLVQNRVNLALPQLPDAVKASGVTTRKRSPGALVLVTLSSPDDSRNTAYLGNYAAVQIKDELMRLAGVADVQLIGGQETGVRIWLDPDKLAARALTASDVTRALREHNAAATAGEVGQPPAPKGQEFQLTIGTGGRRLSPEDVADIVIKTGTGGRTVRLRDVARVELGAGPSAGFARLDGHPVVALAIFATGQDPPRKVTAAVRERMEKLKKAFPSGLDYSLPFDLGPGGGGHLVVEPILPTTASPERTLQLVDRYATTLKRSERVRHVLALSDNPFSRFGDGPCLLADLAAADAEPADRQRVLRALRTRLAEVEGAQVRLRELSGAGGYPLDFAVRGPEAAEVRELAGKLVERLAATRKLTDLAAGRGARTGPQVYVDIDREKVKAMGVSLSDVFDTLQTSLGSYYVNDFNRFGRTWTVQVQLETAGRGPATVLKGLKVRNADGKMIPLTTMVTVREVTGPESIDRLDLRPMVEVTANPGDGVSLAEARWLCETLAEQVRKELRLPAGYGLVWLQELPAAKPMPGELKPAAEEPPPQVNVVQPVAREVTDYEDFTGRLQAISTVDLRARVSGYLDKAPFKEGSDVKKGEVLFEIDPRPYQAELDKAQAAAALGEARLKAAEANLERAKALLGKGGIGREEYDKIVSDRDEAAAAVKVGRANLDLARLNLSFTKVTAPIDGRIGRRLVDPGNLVKADDTLLATIVSLDPMQVTFNVDERTVLRLRRLAGEGKIKSPRDGEQSVLLGLADEEGFPRRGKLDFVNNQVDADTGTLLMRATFANRDGLLLPGLFARVRLPVGAPHKALLVPESAIATDQGQKFLYVVDDQNKVVYRRVRVGPLHDGLRVVEEGLQPDDWVISGGAQRVRAGMTVKPVKVEPPGKKE